jgi:hypothetical protein
MREETHITVFMFSTKTKEFLEVLLVTGDPDSAISGTLAPSLRLCPRPLHTSGYPESCRKGASANRTFLDPTLTLCNLTPWPHHRSLLVLWQDLYKTYRNSIKI